MKVARSVNISEERDEFRSFKFLPKDEELVIKGDLLRRIDLTISIN